MSTKRDDFNNDRIEADADDPSYNKPKLLVCLRDEAQKLRPSARYCALE